VVGGPPRAAPPPPGGGGGGAGPPPPLPTLSSPLATYPPLFCGHRRLTQPVPPKVEAQLHFLYESAAAFRCEVDRTTDGILGDRFDVTVKRVDLVGAATTKLTLYRNIVELHKVPVCCHRFVGYPRCPFHSTCRGTCFLHVALLLPLSSFLSLTPPSLCRRRTDRNLR